MSVALPSKQRRRGTHKKKNGEKDTQLCRNGGKAHSWRVAPAAYSHHAQSWYPCRRKKKGTPAKGLRAITPSCAAEGVGVIAYLDSKGANNQTTRAEAGCVFVAVVIVVCLFVCFEQGKKRAFAALLQSSSAPFLNVSTLSLTYFLKVPYQRPTPFLQRRRCTRDSPVLST
jgi:hypothetical protein